MPIGIFCAYSYYLKRFIFIDLLPRDNIPNLFDDTSFLALPSMRMAFRT